MAGATRARGAQSCRHGGAYAAGASNLPFGTLRGYVGTELVGHSGGDGDGDRLPLHRRDADRRARPSARRRDRARTAGRPGGQRADLGDRRRPEGDRARLGALAGHGRGGRRRARSAARGDRAADVGGRRRRRGAAAARTPPMRTTTTTATTASTSAGMRSAGTATHSGSGWRSTCSPRRASHER